MGVNNPQTEVLLTAANVPFSPVRSLINDLPDTKTIIHHYTKGHTIFSASAKVSALWRLIVYKQFQIKSKHTFDHISAGGGDTNPIVKLVSDAHESFREDLIRIKSALATLLTDLVELRATIEERCPPIYSECSHAPEP